MKDNKFYSLTNILSKKCQYNMIIGERSNGKTYAALKYILEQYVTKGKQGAYLRRWKEDYRGKRGEQLFASLVENGYVSQLTDEVWTNVIYKAGRWYLSRFDEDLNKNILDDEPFCFGFALNDMEHDKSVSYPKVTTIVFDEFLTRKFYLPNEFVIFVNVLSTIIRHRQDVTILMLGNTVNKYCPYFNEMGLKHIQDMKIGTIDVYTYGDSQLRVAVEYCKPNEEGKASDVYFTFDNPALQMITNGLWEIGLYPHSPFKIKDEDIIFNYFIQFDDNLLQADIVEKDNCLITFIHEKTTPIQDEDNDIIFTDAFDPRPNHFRNIRRPTSEVGRKIADFFVKEKVYYQDNEVGEIVRNYLNFCLKEAGKIAS